MAGGDSGGMYHGWWAGKGGMKGKAKNEAPSTAWCRYGMRRSRGGRYARH